MRHFLGPRKDLSVHRARYQAHKLAGKENPGVIPTGGPNGNSDGGQTSPIGTTADPHRRR